MYLTLFYNNILKNLDVRSFDDPTFFYKFCDDNNLPDVKVIGILIGILILF